MSYTEQQEYKRCQAGQAVYERVMKDFERGELFANGKAGVRYTVTKVQQAWAIAKNMASKAEKRYDQAQNSRTSDSLDIETFLNMIGRPKTAAN